MIKIILLAIAILLAQSAPEGDKIKPVPPVIQL